MQLVPLTADDEELKVRLECDPEQALVAYALSSGQVRVVRAHTRPEGKLPCVCSRSLGLPISAK